MRNISAILRFAFNLIMKKRRIGGKKQRRFLVFWKSVVILQVRTLTSGIATSKRSAWKPVIPEDVREYMYMNGR
jgi:hypothetical protein